jgi:hypothetical protein
MEDNNVIKLMKLIEKEFMYAAEQSVKFVEGNNSAGTRVRKTMQNIKNLSQEVRKEVQNQKNTVSA